MGIEKSCEDPAQVMECALDMGETMLRCGAEILRVEETITRICTTYGGGIVDVFTILSLIILSWKTDAGRTIRSRGGSIPNRRIWTSWRI